MMEILRFCILGNIDDGKSTLIGRLLFDTGNLKLDQTEKLYKHQDDHQLEAPDFSIITDGLFDESLQRITIDVAYQYFQTNKRKFIIADAPGHPELTRNMITGASLCDLCLVIIDLSQEIEEQTKRHCALASMLGIKKCIFCLNKMDLVNYDESRFDHFVSMLNGFSSGLNFDEIFYIPICATKGENIVNRSRNMPWYQDKMLMEILNETEIRRNEGFTGTRLPVQFSDANYHYGKLEIGSLNVGDELLLLPELSSNTIESIYESGEPVMAASGGSAVAIKFSDGASVKRGDLLVKKNDQPTISKELNARIAWLSKSEGQINTGYLLVHTTRQVNAKITSINSEWEVNNLSMLEQDRDHLLCNGIYNVQISCDEAIFFDGFDKFRNTGSILICDEVSGQTLAAGILLLE